MRLPGWRTTLTLLAVAGIAAWFVLLGPTALGGPAAYLSVSGTSMEPTLRDGDLAVVRRAAAYGPGDVVAFRVPAGEPAAGRLVIHRIVGGSGADGFITKGDNKAAPDSWRPTSADVVGTLIITVPGAGPVLGKLRQPANFAAILAALAAFMVMLGGQVRRQPRTARRAVVMTPVHAPATADLPRLSLRSSNGRAGLVPDSGLGPSSSPTDDLRRRGTVLHWELRGTPTGSTSGSPHRADGR